MPWCLIDEAARIYREQRTWMFTIAYSRTRNAQDAEDIVQEAAIILMRQREIPDDERGLAYTVTDYAARAWLEAKHMQRRDCRRTERLDTANPKHHGRALSAERVAMGRLELAEVAAAAPPAALALASGYRLADVAAISGQNAKTVYSQVLRWRRANR